MTSSLRGAKKEATRAKLIEEAHQLFVTKGYSETNIREIALAAGVSERTFYRYFETKDELLFPKLRGVIADLLSNLRGVDDEVQVMDAVARAVELTNLASLPRMKNMRVIANQLIAGEVVIDVVRLIVEFEFEFAAEIGRRIAISNPYLGQLDRDTYALVLARFIFNAFRSMMNAREELDSSAELSLPSVPEHMNRIIKLLNPDLPPLT